jgi:hypothetical protein
MGAGGIDLTGWAKPVALPPVDDLPPGAKVDPASVVEDALRATRLEMRRLAQAQADGGSVLDELGKVAKTVEQIVRARGELQDRSKKAAKELSFPARAQKLIEWYEGLPLAQAEQVEQMMQAAKAKRGNR